ncbi:hypothetical protein L53_13050 [Hyphomonas sp. L-53-1-40]|nr:hypothetical protein L53_13050 [Hyphomonas sp. L-53-1-40]
MLPRDHIEQRALGSFEAQGEERPVNTHGHKCGVGTCQTNSGRRILAGGGDGRGGTPGEFHVVEALFVSTALVAKADVGSSNSDVVGSRI